jgi:hypothetical protein
MVISPMAICYFWKRSDQEGGVQWHLYPSSSPPLLYHAHLASCPVLGAAAPLPPTGRPI